jgi:hypothetical protein
MQVNIECTVIKIGITVKKMIIEYFMQCRDVVLV